MLAFLIWRKVLFSGTIKNAPRSNKLCRRVGNTAIGRDTWYASWVLFLNEKSIHSHLGCTAFVNSAYPENWALLYEVLSMLATKKDGCSQGNCTSLSTLNKKLLSTFNFVPKINYLSLKIPISHTFIMQSFCVRQNCIFKIS